MFATNAPATAIPSAVAPNPGGPLLGRANIAYEYSERTKGVSQGGIGMIARLVGKVGLAAEIDGSLELLAQHRPYPESDHVLNIAYNALCGGRRLEDIENRRNDAVFLDGLGVAARPDPTTAGDFCRRFDEAAIMALQDAHNRARLKVWAEQPASFFAKTARIDADASIISTDGDCKQGIDIAYNGIWGYSALIVSLSNTKHARAAVSGPPRRQPSLPNWCCTSVLHFRCAHQTSACVRNRYPTVAGGP